MEHALPRYRYLAQPPLMWPRFKKDSREWLESRLFEREHSALDDGERRIGPQ